jgi:hypothetical protein
MSVSHGPATLDTAPSYGRDPYRVHYPCTERHCKLTLPLVKSLVLLLVVSYAFMPPTPPYDLEINGAKPGKPLDQHRVGLGTDRSPPDFSCW